MNLSPRWREALREGGHEALWWRDVGPPDAPDEEVFAWAKAHGYLLLTADLDFSRLLALTGEEGPSVLLLRLPYPEPPYALEAVLEALKRFQEALEQGALVVIGPDRTRVRVLPL